MNLTDILKDLGYNPPSQEHRANIDIWKAWYRGYVPSFHDYTINNGQNKVRCTRAQLKMAKRGCEYWADLLWNRECFITLNSDKQKRGRRRRPVRPTSPDADQQALDDALEANNFVWQTNQIVDRMLGEGAAAFVVYDVNEEPVIEPISVDYIWPLRQRGNTIESCAFVGVSTNESPDSTYEKIVHLMIHDKQPNGQYWVRNLFYGSNNAEIDLKPIETPEGIREEYFTQTPWFSIFRPNLADASFVTNPFGPAIFANSIGILENIDLAYDGVHVSMKLGRPRIAVKGGAVTIDLHGGEPRPVFDPNDIAFYDIGMDGPVNDNKFVQDITTEYRATEFERSLQAQLQIYSQSIGLGESTFRWEGTNVETAYQAMSINSETARTMRKLQDGIRNPIVNVCRAVLEILGHDPFVNIGITFDDSIVINNEQEKQRWLSMAMAGKIPFWYYLAEFEGLGEEEAKEIDLTQDSFDPDEDAPEE